MAIVECVPNISEGADQSKIDQIISGARDVQGATLISCESDADHNRSVITLAGEGEPVSEAAFRIYQKAIELIDLNNHKGEHPRMGAVDVCPFIPVQDANMQDCVELAEKLGKRVGEELKFPVYLYEAAAKRDDRKNLAKIRKGQFEKLKDLIGSEDDRVPDFGPNAIHPSGGCTAIGARFFLIAYNVNLDSNNIDLAKEIGKTIREKNDGMPGVKAMGFMLEDEGIAQVSMNLVDYRKTSPAQAYKRIEELAAAQDVRVKESEIIGVIPQDTMKVCAEQLGIAATDNLKELNDAVAAALKVKDYKDALVLENNLSN